MPDYNRVPGIDENNRFHPSILEALGDEAILQFQFLTPDRLGPYAADLRNLTTYTNNWNDVTENGYYNSPDALNAPSIGFVWYIGEVISNSKQFVTQTLTEFASSTASDTRSWRRHKLGETWTAWYRLRVSEAEQDARFAVNASILPKGLVYRYNRTSNTGASSDSVYDHIPSFAFKARRHYRIVYDASYYQTKAEDLFQWTINSCAVGQPGGALTNLTVLGARTKGVGSAVPATTQHTGPVTAYFDPGSDVTIMIKVRIRRTVGTGTLVVVGNPDPSTLRIYDDGAVGV